MGILHIIFNQSKYTPDEASSSNGWNDFMTALCPNFNYINQKLTSTSQCLTYFWSHPKVVQITLITLIWKKKKRVDIKRTAFITVSLKQKITNQYNPYTYTTTYIRQEFQ